VTRALGPLPATALNTQRRRVLGLIAAAALPLLLLAAGSAWRAVQDAEARVVEERLALTEAAALVTAAFVENSLSTARTLALAPAFAAPESYPAMDRLLDRMLAENPDWEGLGISDADGWNVVSTDAPPRTLNIADRPYFQHVLATGEPAVSPAVVNRRTGNPTIVLAVPLELTAGGRGVLIISLATARLEADLQAFRGDGTIEIVVLDDAGQTFIHPDPQVMRELTSARGQPAADAVLRGQAGHRQRVDPRGRELLVTYAPAPLIGWGVVARQPTAQAFALVRRQLVEAVGVLTLAVVLTSLIGWNLGNRLSGYYLAELEAKAEAEGAAAKLRALGAESEARRRFLEELIASAPVAIAVLRGPEHRQVTVNPRYQAIKPGAALLGRTVAEAFPELAQRGLGELLDRVYASGEQVTLVDRPLAVEPVPGAPAQERYFTIVLARYEDAHGQPAGVLLIAPETTEAVVARQRADRQKDEFLSTASHELKTPIASLSLSAQMIERFLAGGAAEPERLKRLVAAIRTQTDRATQLVNDLLDVSRLERGAAVLRRAPINLVTLARTAVQRERDMLPDGDPHQLVLAGPGAADVRVAGDEVRLDQVLANLLSNAVKYSPTGGEVRVEVARDGDQAILRVADQGVGLSASELAELFEPFSRTAAARESGIEGSGLGLYISRRIVEAHGGTIAVTETPGGGATFTVALPALAASPARNA
jgi:signal transduction histidine kinase